MPLQGDERCLGTRTNNVQSRRVIFVANDESGHVCAFKSKGINGELSKWSVIKDASNYDQPGLKHRYIPYCGLLVQIEEQ